MSPDEFTKALLDLGAAFGKPLNGQLILQYYSVLGILTREHLDALIKWAIETLDTPFPTIARLRKHTIEQGWFAYTAPLPQTKTVFVEVVCPKCDGTFSVRKDKLLADARDGRVYHCINHDHWGCPMTFSAASLAQEKRVA
jgi:hypothetical protein